MFCKETATVTIALQNLVDFNMESEVLYKAQSRFCLSVHRLVDHLNEPIITRVVYWLLTNVQERYYWIFGLNEISNNVFNPTLFCSLQPTEIFRRQTLLSVPPMHTLSEFIQ